MGQHRRSLNTSQKDMITGYLRGKDPNSYRDFVEVADDVNRIFKNEPGFELVTRFNVKTICYQALKWPPKKPRKEKPVENKPEQQQELPLKKGQESALLFAMKQIVTASTQVLLEERQLSREAMALLFKKTGELRQEIFELRKEIAELRQSLQVPAGSNGNGLKAPLAQLV